MSQTTIKLRLHGPKLTITRGVFITLSTATLFLFILGLPLYYNEYLKDISLETLRALSSLGLSPRFYATYQTSLVVLLAIGCAVAGFIIFYHKSDDWVAILVSFTLIGLGVNAFSPLWLSAQVIGMKTPVLFIMALILASHPFTCYLLPDGRFPQAWMKYAGILWFGWLMVSVFWKSFPVNLFNWDGDGFTIYLFSLLTVLLTGIYALVYRYFHADSVIKKQQLKWVVFSIIFGVLLGVGSNIFITFFEKTHPPQSASLIVNMVTQIISVLAQLSVPAAMVFSILRYRLYDVELVINRSLIYGTLTVLLAILFGAILFGMQAMYQSITGETRPPIIGIILASIVVSVTFEPARKVLREFVNHRIYGMDVDFNEIKRQNKMKDRVSHRPYKDLTNIQGYKDLLLIARGGMGEVYRAQHLHLDRTVAIKVLSTYLKDDPIFNRRFAREAKAMSQLRHPNIINIFDYGDIDGLPYIVMEYLTGPTLTQLLVDKERFTLDECLPLLNDIASALDYIHQLRLIHRDVKPSNIIIEPMTSINGKTQRAILMDFGIVRSQNEDLNLTIDGEMLGTADYASPEQIHGEDDLDHRADVYSFGVMTYQLLTGKRPFERLNTWAMIRAHLEEPPPDAREVAPFLSENAAKAIMKAMAKNRKERFSSAGEFIKALTK